MSFVRIFIRLFRRKDSGTTAHSKERLSSSYSSTDSELSVNIKGLPLLGSTKGDMPLTLSAHSVNPYAIYDGGFPDSQRRGICIRIANGGAGQAGLIKAWSDAFVKEMVARGSEPFQVNLNLSAKARVVHFRLGCMVFG